MRPAARLGGVAVFQVGGMILLWAPTALYAHEGGVHQQRIAGALIMGEGTLVSVALLTWILLGVLREGRVGTLASR